MNKDSDNYSIAGRYRTVRKHLDALGYKQALSLDSLPLIELLLVDLAQSKESLKHFQSIARDNLEACSQLQLAVDPYKCDNAKLVQECNTIHLEIIDLKETHQKQTNDYKKKIRKLESELSDLQLSFSRNLQRIKQLEIESTNKSKKILELQGKCCKPIVNNVNLATKKRACYPLRRPTLEAESLPRISSSATSFSIKTVEPYVIDFVSTADHRISSLNNEVTQLKEELFLNNEYIESLKSQLNINNKEMSRLRKMLEGGRPCTSINKDHCCLVSEKNNGYPRHTENDDLLSLQQAKLNLEQQLKESLNKQHDAMAQAMKLAERNEELEKELNDVDRIALAVEADCNSTVKENNKRVSRLQEQLEDVLTQVHVLENELTVQRREAQELRADLEACRLEKSNVQRILENTLDEKKQMTDRINNLTIMETNLNHEVELNLKKETTQKPVVKKKLSTVNVKSKEKEEKAQANTRKKVIKEKIPASKCPDKRISLQEKGSEFSARSSFKELSSSQGNTDKVLREKNVIIESLQNTIEKLENERDHYKLEYSKFQDLSRKDTEKDNDEMWSQVCELRAQMSEKEHAISKLLREKKELCQEKFNLESKLQNYQMQRNSSHSPCKFQTSPVIDRISCNSNKIDRLEKERDLARADVERLIEERDALRERLKLATETHVSEHRRLRESLAESETLLSKIDRERRELLITQESRRAAIHGLDDQLDDLKEDLRRTKEELTEQRTQYFQLRALQDQTDEALGDVQSQLTQSETELSNAMDRNKNMERQNLQLDNQIKELRQEISTHRSRMAQVDREKDQLLMDLDEKTEKIAALEREIVFKEQQAGNMEQQNQDLSHTKQICIDQAADLERQMRSMQLDMDNLQRQLSSATLDRENAIQENRRLQDDLAAVSCEVRSILKDLEASKAESQDLKRQLQTYVTEVRRAEELLSEKENERTEMLNHFRSLSLEATVLENNNHSLETEAAEARGALQSARDQILDLQRQITDKDCLVRGYEAQITELTQNVASLEIQLQQATEQRLCAEEDLRTVRCLCMTLEQQKECISQRLNENTDLKTQYEVQISRFRSEQDIFQDQMNKDHVQIDRLEKLLEEARKETINGQSNCREYQNEISKLKKKVSELQTKLSKETAEVRKYQTQAAEYNKQVTELRREVTNEKFERARMQDSQRYNKALVPRNQRAEALLSSNEVDVGILRRSNCVCSKKNSGNTNTGSNRCKVGISELHSPANGLTNSNCYKMNYSNKQQQQQLVLSDCLICKAHVPQDAQIKRHSYLSNTSRICLCTGRRNTTDSTDGQTNNNDNKFMKVDAQNKPSNKEISNSTGHCKRCGGRKKQKQSSQSTTLSWITDTISLMYKFLEGKKKLIPSYDEQCKENQNSCNGTMTLNIVKQDEVTLAPGDTKIKLSQEILKTKDKIKYSFIQTCNSNCTVSTQTRESIITISDTSGPNLLKILSEIQHYAKCIEEQFYEANNKTETLADSNNSLKEINDQKYKSISPNQSKRIELTSSKLLDNQSIQSTELNSIDDVPFPTELISAEDLPLEGSLNTDELYSIDDQTLFTDIPSGLSGDERLDESDITTFQIVPLASTPKDSITEVISNVESSKQTESTVVDSAHGLSLSNEQEEVLKKTQDSDEDSTEYLPLPKVIRAEISEDNNVPQDSAFVASYSEDLQDNDIDEELDEIDKKIERLRRDVLTDVESLDEIQNNDKNLGTIQPPDEN